MESSPVERLSQGQRACLRLIEQHLSIKEVAQALVISPDAVVARLREARRILGVSRSLDAARLLAKYETGPDYIRDVDMSDGVPPGGSSSHIPAQPEERPGHIGEVRDEAIYFVPDYPRSPVAAVARVAGEGRNRLSPGERLRQIGEAAVKIAVILCLVFLCAILLSQLRHR